jgi:hypothetical protein
MGDHCGKSHEGLERRGLPLTKITVDTENLLLWFNERGLKVNGESRSHYTSWLLKEKGKADRT